MDNSQVAYRRARNYCSLIREEEQCCDEKRKIVDKANNNPNFFHEVMSKWSVKEQIIRLKVIERRI